MNIKYHIMAIGLVIVLIVGFIGWLFFLQAVVWWLDDCGYEYTWCLPVIIGFVAHTCMFYYLGKTSGNKNTKAS